MALLNIKAPPMPPMERERRWSSEHGKHLVSTQLARTQPHAPPVCDNCGLWTPRKIRKWGRKVCGMPLLQEPSQWTQVHQSRLWKFCSLGQMMSSGDIIWCRSLLRSQTSGSLIWAGCGPLESLTWLCSWPVPAVSESFKTPFSKKCHCVLQEGAKN